MFGEEATKGQLFPKDRLPAKINKLKSHSPTIHSEGYAVRRPLSDGLLEYLSDDRKQEYIRGYRTPESELATPPPMYRYPDRPNSGLFSIREN